MRLSHVPLLLVGIPSFATNAWGHVNEHVTTIEKLVKRQGLTSTYYETSTIAVTESERGCDCTHFYLLFGHFYGHTTSDKYRYDYFNNNEHNEQFNASSNEHVDIDMYNKHIDIDQ
ncbi:hypothetical protein BDV06DRAFT_225376 [Aspergillus oleicola]